MKEREAIEDEIEKLRYELSVVIPQEMKTAVELGDLKENSEFSSVVTKQHFINIRLKQLTDRLKTYKAIDINSIPKDSVGLGSIIKAKHVEENKIVHFKVVLNEITDELSNDYEEITIKSPLGKAFSKKQVKDEVVVSLPKGKATYKILKITTIHDL